jgi:hypothetical protein
MGERRYSDERATKKQREKDRPGRDGREGDGEATGSGLGSEKRMGACVSVSLAHTHTHTPLPHCFLLTRAHTHTPLLPPRLFLLLFLDRVPCVSICTCVRARGACAAPSPRRSSGPGAPRRPGPAPGGGGGSSSSGGGGSSSSSGGGGGGETNYPRMWRRRRGGGERGMGACGRMNYGSRVCFGSWCCLLGEHRLAGEQGDVLKCRM